MNDYAHVMNDDEDEYDREYDRTAQLVELGQGNRAVDVLTSLLAHYPEYEGNTRILLAFAHMRADHVDDAVTSARAAVRLLPQEPEAHRVLGQALACLGDEAAAEHSLRTCLALNPHNAEAHSLIGGLLAEAKRHEEAIVHAREAVRLEPDNPRHHYTLGCALYLPDRAGAEAAQREALRLDPAFGDALLQLAFVRTRRGDHKGAAHDIAAFAAQNPGSSAVRTSVDLFLAHIVTALVNRTVLYLILMLIMLGLVTFTGLPAVIAALLPMPVAVRYIGTYVYRRVQALREALPNGGRQIIVSFLRRRPLVAVCTALLGATWIGLAIGVGLLLTGNAAALGWTITGGLIAALICWRLLHVMFSVKRT